MIAARHGRVAVVRELLGAPGMAVNATDRDGLTALSYQYARRNRHDDIAQLPVAATEH